MKSEYNNSLATLWTWGCNLSNQGNPPCYTSTFTGRILPPTQCICEEGRRKRRGEREEVTMETLVPDAGETGCETADTTPNDREVV